MLHQLAKSAVAELAKAGVVLDAVEDFDHLVNLDRLARAADEASNDWKTRQALFPVVGVAGVTLRRLSIGAGMFLDEHVFPFMDENDRATEVGVLAFAMAHAEDPQKHLLPFAGQPDKFAVAVNEWLKGVGATWGELDRAVAALLKRGDETEALARSLLPPSKKRERREPNWPSICGELAEHFGRDPEWWFWQAPDALLDEMLEKLNARAEAELKASQPKGGIAAPDPNSRFIRARRALAAYKEKVLAEKKPKAGAP